METIKICVDVNVDFSQSTKEFISSLFKGYCVVPNATSGPVEKENPAPAPAAAPAKTEKPAAPARSENAASAAAAPAKSSTDLPVSIEDVRMMLSKKVNDHRDSIKQKLNELGAPSVTKLDPAKYEEMYNFLAAL